MVLRQGAAAAFLLTSAQAPGPGPLAESRLPTGEVPDHDRTGEIPVALDNRPERMRTRPETCHLRMDFTACRMKSLRISDVCVDRISQVGPTSRFQKRKAKRNRGEMAARRRSSFPTERGFGECPPRISLPGGNDYKHQRCERRQNQRRQVNRHGH